MRNVGTVGIQVMAVLIATGPGVLGADEAPPRQTGTVLLRLAEGVAPAAPDDRYTRDMELELTLRDGKFQKQVHGYAVNFNKADHDGELIVGDGGKITVKLTLNKDKWWPPSPGSAEYQIELERRGDAYAGSFSGTLAFTGGEGPVKTDVKGKVSGKVYPLWTLPPAGFKKLEPGEHPRLLFRKGDLPMLKKRLETPEGKAIMARLLAALPTNHATHAKCQPYYPAGYALAYQLTGEKAHAEKAKEILSDMLGLGGSQDIHYGPQAQAIAVTLDLCYDAWDAEFRQKVIDNLAARVRNLDTLTGMGGASLNPWHNHEAIRAGGAGVGAICLLGEKSGGKEIPGLERIIHNAARSTRRYFQYNGTSNSGWGLEGAGYKRMTWNSGPGHMAQAYKTAFGGDLMAGWWGHWSILGEWMQQPPAEKVVAAEGLGSDQYSGLFVMGLTSVPDSMKAGARWLFDRAYGLEGDKTFGLLWAYHAGYLLMNYPFDVAPKPPRESLPWIAPDPTGGHWIFRKPWQGAGDTLVVLNVRHDFPGGTHWVTGRSWDMQLFALGKLWVGDRVMSEKTGGPGAALPTAANPGAFNDMLSARLTDWNSTPDGRASLSFDMSPIYMQSLARGAAPAAGQQMVKMARSGSFVDLGIRAGRHVALDLSAACGAPVLMVVVDKTTGAKDLAWNLKLAAGAGAAKVEGNVVTVGEPSGSNLKCTFLAPKTPVLTGAIKATGGEDYLAVITVQNGAAPAIKVEGDGLSARVSVGSRRVRIEAARAVIE